MKLIVLKNNVPLNDVSVETTDPHEMYEIYVGRSEDCHVQIDDPLISRHHFVLKNENGTWYCDKLSQLGVITINGSLVTKNQIQNGDEIKSGPYSIIVMDLTPLKQASPVIEPAPVTTSFTQTKIPVAEEEPSLVHEPAELDETIVLSEKKSEPVDDLSSFDDDLGDTHEEASPLDFDDSSESESSAENSEENSDIDFGGGELSESTDFNSGDESSEGSYDIATTDDSNESTRFFKAFVNYQLVLFGEHAPYDRFQIDVDEVYIGREPKKCQIILNDPEVSSVHAVLKKNNAEITLEDLNSSNGTILNGERINKAVITAGDEFVIGGTSFMLEVRSDLLESESARLMPVQSNQVVETEEVIEEEIGGDGDLSFEGDAVPEKSLLKRFKNDPAFRKKAIYAIAGLLIVMFLIPTEEETDKPKKAPVAQETKAPDNGKPKLNLSKELENARNVAYELGVSFFEQSRYDLAQVEFQKVVSIDPAYKNVQSYLEQTNVGLKRIQELEAERRAEEDRIKTKKIIDELMVKAREAVKERQVPVAESLFAQIIEKDPENIEVSQLKLELESWQKEEERKALERAARDAARKRMVDALSPGKTFYLKKEWYRSINKLEDFLRIKEMDEDLIKEASEMLSDAKNQLASDLGPLLGRARSLKEGQDLKSSYQAYLEVLRIEPSNKEALDEVDEIKSLLDARSKKVYREAIIAESLSLFGDAKEKFQEVQQISPTDSDYYKKASEKLKSYLE